MAHQPIPVFILGSGRSGTTITATLLNHVRGVHIAKETGFIGQNLALLEQIDQDESLRLLITHVNAWLEKEQWEQRASVAGYHTFCTRYAIRGAAAFIHYVWQLDSPTPWHELDFIGDNTPLYVMAIPALLAMMPEARFIHMVRDPRDVVCSICKMRFGADDLVTAAMEWHLYEGCWLMAERIVSPNRRIECRYEDLCTSPEQTFVKVAAFLDRPESEALAALALHASAGSKPRAGFQKVAGLSHHTRLNEPLNPSRVARYKSELSPRQILAVEEIAQYGMAAYGYPASKWHVHPLMREDRAALLKASMRDLFKRALKRCRVR